jgi:hypothetical protein
MEPRRQLDARHTGHHSLEFAPDGLNIPNAGLGSGSNNVNAKMTSTFGSLNAGKEMFRQVFARWSDLTGISYNEIGDDGATWGASGSSARGDVRIAAHAFTNNNVLAYNYFPGSGLGGDMVVNSGISWVRPPTTGGPSATSSRTSTATASASSTSARSTTPSCSSRS